MNLTVVTLLSSLLSIPPEIAPNNTKSCSLLGPVFSQPQKLSTDPQMIAAGDQFSMTLGLLQQQDVMTTGYGQLDFKGTSFSIQLFSLHEQEPLSQYHYTAPAASNSTFGTRVVDQDTIYRIGSSTKLLTVWLFIIEAGDGVLRDPVTKYVPELLDNASMQCSGSSMDNTTCTMWSDVTIGDLASHMAGIQKELTLRDVSAAGLPVTQFGFPSLNASDVPNCSTGLKSPLCDRKAFFKDLANANPIFPSSSTPSYSNIAYQILGYALEGLTNKTFAEVFQERLVKPLGLNHTSYTQPASNSLSIIPGDPITSFYSVPIGDEGPAGGAYSSSTDFTAMARAILSSQLLSPATTRRWMKPVTHTSSLTTSIGAAWEIQRISTDRVVDLYTKEGDLGSYAAMLTLIPDYDVGFTVLTAGDTAVPAMQILSEKIVDQFLPALGRASRSQSKAMLTGEFRSPTINSSVSLGVDDGPGLVVTKWLSNGTDLLSPAFQKTIGTKFSGVRLFPTGLKTTQAMAQKGNYTAASSTATATRVSWRAVFQRPVATDESAFADKCPDWADFTEVVYGGKLLSEFVFGLAGGNVTGLEIPALRVSLRKSQ